MAAARLDIERYRSEMRGLGKRNRLAVGVGVIALVTVASLAALVVLGRFVQVAITVELIRALPNVVWAVVVLILVMSFRSPLADLIPRLGGLKAFGVEASFVKDELDRAAKETSVGSAENRSQVARRAARIATLIKGTRALLVNDVPAEMRHVISILESLGVGVDVMTTSDAALSALSRTSYDVVISDVRRGDVPDEGIRFVHEARARGVDRPTILTVGIYLPEKGVPPYVFGITSQVDELLNLVFDVLERTRG